MARSKRAANSPVELPPPAAQVSDILRDLARWAVASSLGLGGACSSHHGADHMGQVVPKAPEAGTRSGSAGSVQPSAGRGPTAQAGREPEPPTAQAGREPEPPTGTAGSPPAPAAWEVLACAANGTNPNVIMLDEFTRRLDFAGLFASYPAGMGQVGAFPAGVTSMAQAGTPCATARARAECEARLDELFKPSDVCAMLGGSSCRSFVVTTVGDEVTRSEERGALLALLGPIDSPEKAILVALYDRAFDGNSVQCAPAGAVNLLGRGETRSSGDGFDVRSTWDSCVNGVYSETLHVSADGTATIAEAKTKVGESQCSVGRRPAGLRAAACLPQRTRIGAFLADAARLEAASVFAFERLARELAALGAPEALQAEALRSALDEIRHARMVGALARRFGGAPSAPEVAPLPERSRFAIALENAIEGCVRETYGALVAEHQAQTAADPELRAALRAIADDELRHALLAHRVAAWLEPQLSAKDRHALASARSAAIIQLFAELDPGLAPAELALLGWPSRAVAGELIQRMGRALGVA